MRIGGNANPSAFQTALPVSSTAERPASRIASVRSWIGAFRSPEHLSSKDYRLLPRKPNLQTCQGLGSKRFDNTQQAQDMASVQGNTPPRVCCTHVNLSEAEGRRWGSTVATGSCR